MEDRKVVKAKTEVRREREASVWKVREDVGREARQADAPRQQQGASETEGSRSPKAGARLRQSPSA